MLILSLDTEVLLWYVTRSFSDSATKPVHYCMLPCVLVTMVFFIAWTSKAIGCKICMALNCMELRHALGLTMTSFLSSASGDRISSCYNYPWQGEIRRLC